MSHVHRRHDTVARNWGHTSSFGSRRDFRSRITLRAKIQTGNTMTRVGFREALNSRNNPTRYPLHTNQRGNPAWTLASPDVVKMNIAAMRIEKTRRRAVPN